MIFKLSGALVLFCLCVLIANNEKANLKYKYEYLMGIVNALYYLEKEIVFFSSYLGVALNNTAQYAGVACDLFRDSGELLSNDSSALLGDIFLDFLKIDDIRIKTIIKEFGEQLGTCDIEGEEILINNTIMRLTGILDEYKNDYYEKGKLIGKTGIIIGMFLAILIL